MNVKYRSSEDQRTGSELLQNLINAAGDHITRAPILYDAGGYFNRFKQAFIDYNEWLKR